MEEDFDTGAVEETVRVMLSFFTLSRIGISGMDGNIMLNLARMAICTLIGLFAALAAGGTAALQIPLSGKFRSDA